MALRKDKQQLYRSLQLGRGRVNLLYELQDEVIGMHKADDAWRELRRNYTSSKRTVWSDRLAAIRGIAALVGDLTGDRYCGSMWLTDDLPNALLWHVKGEPPERPGTYLRRGSVVCRLPLCKWHPLSAVPASVLHYLARMISTISQIPLTIAL